MRNIAARAGSQLVEVTEYDTAEKMRAQLEANPSLLAMQSQTQTEDQAAREVRENAELDRELAR